MKSISVSELRPRIRSMIADLERGEPYALTRNHTGSERSFLPSRRQHSFPGKPSTPSRHGAQFRPESFCVCSRRQHSDRRVTQRHARNPRRRVDGRRVLCSSLPIAEVRRAQHSGTPESPAATSAGSAGSDPAAARRRQAPRQPLGASRPPPSEHHRGAVRPVSPDMFYGADDRWRVCSTMLPARSATSAAARCGVVTAGVRR